MISHLHHSIFVHVPKTAGTSIEHKLGHFTTMKWGVQDHRPIRDVEPLTLWELVRMAPSAEYVTLLRRLRDHVRRRPQISRRQYDTYYKFAFVRNSWARIYSWYRNVMRDPRLRREYGVETACTFTRFLQVHLNPKRGPMRPQLYWLQNRRGQIPLDFIGRFEHLEVDFGRVCQVLRIQDATLPQLIIGEHRRRYTEAYNDATRRMIGTIYAPEIAEFNFQFGE